jgi:hypothetical protein
VVGVAGTDLLYKSAQGCEELPTSTIKRYYFKDYKDNKINPIYKVIKE